MLIRIDADSLREFPDEIAILILADPSMGDEKPDFTAQEVNVLVHGIVGTFYDHSLSFEENVEKVRERFSIIDKPTDENYSIACEAIKSYKDEISEDEIGMVDSDEVFSTSDTLPLKKIT